MADTAVDAHAVEQARADLARFMGPDALAALDRYMAAVVDAAQPPAPIKRWLTVEEAAAELGCSPGTMRKRLDRGLLPKHRQGGRVYVDRFDLDGALAGSVG